MRLARSRGRALLGACLMLLTMAINCGLELGMVVRAQRRLARFEQALAAPAPTNDADEATLGTNEPLPPCCQQKKMTKLSQAYKVMCTCKCCGPVCSMGEDCTCGKPKVRVPVGGMFFVAPSCHPGQSDGLAASYVPGSLHFAFLPPHATSSLASAPPAHPYPSISTPTGVPAAPPPTPPPKAAAVRVTATIA